MPRPELPPCPACGQKLPYDRNPHTNRQGQRVRLRKCSCGYIRLERVDTVISETYPEGWDQKMEKDR